MEQEKSYTVFFLFYVLDGVVTYICFANNGFYGKYVVLEHKGKGITFYSLYAHLDCVDPSVQRGEFLSKGKKIGLIGDTSSVYKIKKGFEHLHFEVGLRL